MGPRLRHFHANVGTLGTVQFALFHLLLLLALAGPFLTPQLPWYLSIVVLVAYTIPFALRRVMAHHWEFTGPLVRRFGLTVVCASVAAGFVKDRLLTVIPEPLLVSIMAAVIGLYISAMFWFASDPSITMTRTKPR